MNIDDILYKKDIDSVVQTISSLVMEDYNIAMSDIKTCEPIPFLEQIEKNKLNKCIRLMKVSKICYNEKEQLKNILVGVYSAMHGCVKSLCMILSCNESYVDVLVMS